MDDTGCEIVLFDFRNPAVACAWHTVNDTVMGGVSASTIEATDNGTALFRGMVSLDNFGGFCSASSSGTGPYNLSNAEGIAVRVRGDGKQYKLLIKTDAGLNGFSYQFSFATKQGAWMTVHAPFQEFVARFRGAIVHGAPPLNRGHVVSLGFLIGERQEGPFALEIESIKAYGLKRG
ncbi:MAG: CIA30 family protein [Desulfobacterota bacterium]|nr:CIA30 family protein [Thermodesulfobacteriota bacterium]